MIFLPRTKRPSSSKIKKISLICPSLEGRRNHYLRPKPTECLISLALKVINFLLILISKTSVQERKTSLPSILMIKPLSKPNWNTKLLKRSPQLERICLKEIVLKINQMKFKKEEKKDQWGKKLKAQPWKNIFKSFIRIWMSKKIQPNCHPIKVKKKS